MKFEQIFSLRCQTEQAQSTKLDANSFSNDSSSVIISTRHLSAIRRIVAVYDDPFGSRVGGAGRDRTDDILLAKQALSQLSYGP